MALKEKVILYKVNEYLKKPEVKKMLVDKIIEASKDPKFKEFLKEDMEKIISGLPAKRVAKIPDAKKQVFVKQATPDKESIKKATREILKEWEREIEFKEKHRTLGGKLIGTILQSKIWDFRLRDLYLKQQGFAWTASITITCFILAFVTKLNNQTFTSRLFLAIGTGLLAGGFLIYYFFSRTYNQIFEKGM